MYHISVIPTPYPPSITPMVSLSQIHGFLVFHIYMAFCLYICKYIWINISTYSCILYMSCWAHSTLLICICVWGWLLRLDNYEGLSLEMTDAPLCSHRLPIALRLTVWSYEISFIWVGMPVGIVNLQFLFRWPYCWDVMSAAASLTYTGDIMRLQSCSY